MKSTIRRRSIVTFEQACPRDRMIVDHGVLELEAAAGMVARVGGEWGEG